MQTATQTAPPKIRKPSSALTFFTVAIFGFAILGASAAVYFFNPSSSGFYPVCQFHRLTGLNCPGCGATRALYALLHGNFLLALKDNALFLLTLAVATIIGARFFLKKRINPDFAFHLSQKFLWSYLALAIVFSVLRNFPVFSFLSP